MLPEIFKIAAVIKNQEPALVRILSIDLIDTGKATTQSCAPSNHLPKFCFRAYFFEEHQIDRVRYVDAGIHHIHRYCDMRLFFRLLKVVDNRLGIGIVTDNPLGKRAVILRVQLVEPLQNKLCMTLVLGKDDGFPQAVSARHLNAPLHQILQHNVHCGFIEHKLVELFRWDDFR